MKKFLTTLLAVFLLVSFSSTLYGYDDDTQVLLETVGALAAQGLYITYSAIGSTLDSWSFEAYTDTETVDMILEYVGMCEAVSDQLDILLDSDIMNSEDIAYVSEIIDAFDILIDEGDAAKTGMVSNKEIIEIIVDRVKRYKIEKLVVDPVMIAKSGAHLLRKDAEKALIEKILPAAFLVTPNVFEAEIISGRSIKNIEYAKESAKLIQKMGIKNVLLKGGHLSGENAIDILFDGKDFTFYESARRRLNHIQRCFFDYDLSLCET